MDEELDEIVSVPFDEDDIDESNQVYRTYKMDFEKTNRGNDRWEGSCGTGYLENSVNNPVRSFNL